MLNIVSRYAFTEVPHMYRMFDDACQDEDAAHCHNKGTFFPITDFQTEKHFIASIGALE
jgi:hypothetical protein